MNKAQWFWFNVALPPMGVGIVAFFSSIYIMYMVQGDLCQKLNHVGVFICVFLSFGSISVATLLAAKGKYLQSKIIKRVFSYMLVFISFYFGIYLLWSTGSHVYFRYLGRQA
ncbi:hypothetical protein MAH1_36910 [Sessilibacter sp. MAH1]